MQKKKLWIIIGSILASIIVLAISLPIILLSNKTKEINWDKVIFESKTVIYDGEIHYLEVKGDFPSSMEITYDNNGHKEVGIYEVTAHFKNKNQTYPDRFATLTIVKDGLDTITFHDQTYTYDGQEKSIYIEGELAEGIEVTYTNNNQMNAGVYEVTATFKSKTDDEVIGILKATLTILKAVLSLDTIDFHDRTIPYDGTSKSLVAENLPEGIEVIYVNNDHTEIGVYEVTATFHDLTGNYQIEGNLKATLTIIKGTYDMSSVLFDSVEFPYDGQEHAIFITGQLPIGVEVLRYIENKRTEIGTSHAIVEFIGDEKNYNPISKMEATLTIVKGKMTFLKETEFITTYTGEYQRIDYPNLPEGVNVEYESNSFKDAGRYEVVAHFKDALERYIEETKLLYLIIQKATYDMSNVYFMDDIIVYDGMPHSIAITGKLPAGVEVTYTNNILKEIGQLEVIATFHIPDEKNYNQIPAKKATLTIVPEKLTGVWLEDQTFVYDGNIHGLTLEGELPLGVTYEFENNYKKEVGVYEVTVKFNIESYPQLKAKLTIIKADIDLSNIYFHSQTFVYDGMPHSIFIEGILPDIVSVRYENNTRTIVGSQTATAIFEVLDKKHYNDIPNMTAIITVIENEITGISFKNKTVIYNRQPQSIYIEGELPDGVSVTYDGNAQVNAGVYVVTAHFHDSTGKFDHLNDMTATLTILKASFGVGGILFLDKTVTYDGTTHSLEAYLDDLPPDIQVVYENNHQVNAGVYEVKVSFIDSVGNYKPVPSLTATLTILKRKISLDAIVFEDAEFEYDGFEHTITIQGDLPEDVIVTYDRNSYTQKGRYLVTAKFIVDEKNNEPIPSLQAYLTITQGPLENIYLTDKEVVYDGSIHGLEILGDLPSGVSVEYLNNYQINAGVYKVTALFKDHDGYYNSLTATLTILKATYDMSGITFEDEVYTYDGNTHTLEVKGILPEGVEVKYSQNTLTNAGSLVVFATFIGNPNYEDIPQMIATLTIEKIVIPGLSFEDGTFSYDGMPHSIYVKGIEGYPIDVKYYGNNMINAGTYEVIAAIVLTNPNYEAVSELRAHMIITPIPMNEVTLEDKTFILDGKIHSLETSSSLPEGVYAIYENNGQMFEGTYIVTMRLESYHSNYILPEPLSAKLIIVSDGSYHMVVFHLGNGEMIKKIVEHEKGISDIPVPVNKPGYEGYYEEDFTYITSKLECYPVYRKSNFMIYFDHESLEPLTVEYESRYHLPIPVKEDYIFKKWVDRDGNRIEDGLYQWTDDITLYPIWQCKVILAHPKGHIYEELYLDSNECVKPTFSFSSYLEGFYLDKELKEKFDLNAPIEVNLTLYTKYAYDFSYTIDEQEEVEIIEILDKTKASYNFLERIDDLYSVCYVPDYVFYGCTNLEEVYLPILKEEFGKLFGEEEYENAVAVSQRQATYYFPKSLRKVHVKVDSISTFQFYNCFMLEEIILENVKHIEGFAFNNCSNIEEITIIGSPSIEEKAFLGCDKIIKVGSDSLASWANIKFTDHLSSPMNREAKFFIDNEVLKTINLKDIPDIGQYQFYNFSQIRDVKLQGVQIIHDYAFMNCENLDSIWIGNSLNEFMSDTFAGDVSLHNVYYDGTMTEYSKIKIANLYATPMYFASNFYIWDLNTYVLLTDIILEEEVETVGDYQFYGFKNINKIELKKVSFIGKYSFSDMGKINLFVMPEMVEEIDIEAFNQTIISHVSYLGNLEKWVNISFLSLNSTPLASKNGSITFDSFPLNFDNIVLPGNIESIDAYQFYGFKDAVGVEISAPIHWIGESAFAECRSLVSFTFQSEGDLIIYENAFLGSSNLKDVYYNGYVSSYTKIKYKNFAANPLYYQANLWIRGDILEELSIGSNPDKYQFAGIKSLKKVILEPSVTELADGVFSDCSSLSEIINIENVLKLGANTFEKNSSLVSINLPNVTLIPTSCFKDCTNLVSITISNATKIESSAFMGAKKLSAISLEKVEELKDSAFKGASSLREITLGPIKLLEHDTFANCFGLEKVTLPETLKEIHYSAFSGCSKLNELIIPSSVDVIKSNSFVGSLNLVIYAKKEQQPSKWVNNWNAGIKKNYWYSDSYKEGNYWHYDNDSNPIPW